VATMRVTSVLAGLVSGVFRTDGIRKGLFVGKYQEKSLKK
jgi:hypothetical protein